MLLSVQFSSLSDLIANLHVKKKKKKTQKEEIPLSKESLFGEFEKKEETKSKVINPVSLNQLSIFEKKLSALHPETPSS